MVSSCRRKFHLSILPILHPHESCVNRVNFAPHRGRNVQLSLDPTEALIDVFPAYLRDISLIAGNAQFIRVHIQGGVAIPVPYHRIPTFGRPVAVARIEFLFLERFLLRLKSNNSCFLQDIFVFLNECEEMFFFFLLGHKGDLQSLLRADSSLT